MSLTDPSRHIPILLDTILKFLPFHQGLPDDGSPVWLVDCTLGGGGHTASFLDWARDKSFFKVLALDRDPEAIARAQIVFRSPIAEGKLELMHRPFSEVQAATAGKRVAWILADLGVSSDQIDTAGRGFSFQGDGPLDMRMDPTSGASALNYLRTVELNELTQVLFGFGEERFAKKIAHAIIRERQAKRLPTTTRQLADLVVEAVPPPARHQRIHAATRTFQALRIQVNNELEELDSILQSGIISLMPGGRMAILSFHSLEDRRVKQAYRIAAQPDWEDRKHTAQAPSQKWIAQITREGRAYQVLTKKPAVADEVEVSRNPRSRSAKLRVLERLR